MIIISIKTYGVDGRRKENAPTPQICGYLHKQDADFLKRLLNYECTVDTDYYPF